MKAITWDEFASVELRVGTVLEVEDRRVGKVKCIRTPEPKLGDENDEKEDA